jgi:succinate dehydrogenase / fumarate reductase flavoprotein subunit
MSALPGLFVIGEANFSDHGANRLGASALMQALADGYFIVPRTIGHYLAATTLSPLAEGGPEARAARAEVELGLRRLLEAPGTQPAVVFHRELGEILWQHCGLARERSGLVRALEAIQALSERFWRELRVPGDGAAPSAELELAGRVADFLELGELLCLDALAREESCGSHFRVEHASPDGEALRDDARFAHVAVYRPRDGGGVERSIEPLSFGAVTPSARSYQ